MQGKMRRCFFPQIDVYFYDLYPTNTHMDEFGQPNQPVQQAIDRERTTQPVASGSIKAGEVLRTFSVLEGAPYTRSRRWMWMMLLLVVVLLAIAFGIDGWNSIPMALAFIALVVVYGMTIRHDDGTRRVPLIFTTYGIQLAGRFYPYTELPYFYLVQFPSYVQITIRRETRFSNGLEVFLAPTDDVEAMRQELSDHVPENLSAKETLVQRLIRVLQL